MAHMEFLRTWLLAGGLLSAVSATHAGAAPAPMQGQWAGDRLQLVVDAQGGRLESDCASGRINGPITLSADGRFVAQGSFESHQPGPQRADEPARAAAASFAGELRDGVLKLTITPTATGAGVAQSFTLQSGARVKLLRCL
jgi:hypothetical protein